MSEGGEDDLSDRSCEMATDGDSLFDTAMGVKATDVPNVRQAVPFFSVNDFNGLIIS